MCLNDARPELTLSPRGVWSPSGTVEPSPERALRGRLPIPGKDWLREHSSLYGFAVGRYDVLLRHLGFRAEPLPPFDQIERLYLASPEGKRFRGLLARLGASVEIDGSQVRRGLLSARGPAQGPRRTASSGAGRALRGRSALSSWTSTLPFLPRRATGQLRSSTPMGSIRTPRVTPWPLGRVLTVLRPWIGAPPRRSNPPGVTRAMRDRAGRDAGGAPAAEDEGR